MEHKTNFTFMTLNVQGLRNVHNRQTLFSWLNCAKPDIICLQETHSISEEEFRAWVTTETNNNNNQQQYLVASSPGSARRAGVAILYKPCFQVKSTGKDAHGRFLLVTFCHEEVASSFQVLAVYGPNQKRPGEEFFASLLPLMDPTLPIVLCGDFNAVVDPYLDRFGCNPESPWAYNWPSSLSTLIDRYDLIDIWRKQHPEERSYTWRRANGSQASRLDMFWISSSLSEHVSQVDILPFFRSDHSYVYLQLAFPALPDRGPGVWKLNASILKDEALTAEVRDFWLSWRTEQATFPSLAVWWDAGKARLKTLLRQYSRNKACSRRDRVRSLENELVRLHSREAQGDNVSHLIRDVKAQVELEHLHRAEGARIRAREQWAEEGETSSAYFLRQEKVRARRRLFTGIRNAQGVIVRSISAILRVWVLFYVHLFSAATLSPADQEFFINSLDCSLSNEESSLCEGEVTLEECTRALHSFKNNKSPGLDGFPYEFYSKFWDLVGPDLVATFNDSFRQGSLSFSQRTGLITLLYKKHDRLDTKNWRPISLLCTDYKILSKVLTNRLKSVLASVISESQSCGVPGRFSGSNIPTLQDIVNHCNFHKSGGALVSLDQEKAFDRVDWGYMQKVLTRMNFGPSFCSWVRLLYTNIFSRVLVNGYTSGAFAVTRGVRQGCPLSPLLYIIVAETIACAIKKDPNIDGFRLTNGEYVKIFQYADDTSVIVHSYHALRSLFSLFERYELASGAKLNVTKSHGLLFGTWKYQNDLPVQLDWSSEAITVLGCRIANEESVDWDGLISKFQNQINLWQQRQLSFRGRALVANVLGLSLFWYQATVFDMPKTVILKINKILFPFVWGKKREWMARTSDIQPLHQGGLGVVDISQKVLSLRAVWLRRFFLYPHHPWSSFFSQHVASSFADQSVAQVLSRTPIPAYLIKKLPPFYRGILTAWIQLKGTQADGSWIIPRPHADPISVVDLTAKVSYTLLTKATQTEHRCVAKFRDLNIPVTWNQAWSSLRIWQFVRSVKDTAWLTFHGILPTADRLVRFGMNVNPACFCGEPETLLHLFTSCPFASEVFQWFTIQLRKYHPTAALTTGQILFGFESAFGVPIVFTALLGILRHHVWLARNKHRFEQVPPDAPTTLKNAKSTFRFLVRMHKRHCTREVFERDWLVDGIVGCVTEQDWIRFTRDFIT